MRIDKFLSNLKYGSRKEISELVKRKRVQVNGMTISKSSINIDPENDVVVLDGEVVEYERVVLLMMNKPSGYLSSNEKGKTKTVYDLISEPYHRYDLKIAGRLDKDTEGLLLLTNDGELLHNIISPNKEVYKKYLVIVDTPFDFSLLEEKMVIKDGRNYDYTPSNPKVERISDTSFYLSIHEGKYHQVKRMVRYCNSTVTYLKRVSIGELVLDENLQLGEIKKVNISDI